MITDHFTRFAQAIPCKNQTAHTTAKALYENFFLHYSFPEKVHSDQGRNFESWLIKQLCKLLGIKKSRTTPYHPMGNGSAERFNQTLIKMLSTLSEEQKTDWKSYVAPLVQAYNSIRNDATGYTPHYLMFGWHPKLAIDVFFGMDPHTENADKGDHPTYISKLRDRMAAAYSLASSEAKRIAEKNKRYHDSKVRFAQLEVGDRVLVRKVGIKGKHKLADQWDSEVYTVQSIPNPEIPVFKVRSSSGKVTKTLHRNMLLPFTSIPESDLEIPSKRVAKKIRKSSKKGTNCSSSSESTESDSDGSETDTVTCRIIRSSVKPVLSSREAKISSINSNHGISSSLQNSSVPEPTNQLDQQVDNASVVCSDM